MQSTIQFVVSKDTIANLVASHLVAMSAVSDVDSIKSIEFTEKDFWNKPLEEGLVTIKIHKEDKS